VVAANKHLKKLLIGEAKSGKDSVSRAILIDLIKRSQRMPQESWQVQYALFSIEGFNQAAVETAEEFDVQLVTPQEMEKAFTKLYEH